MDAPSGMEAKKMCEDDENDEALVQKWRGSVPTSISMHRAEVCSVVPPGRASPGSQLCMTSV